MSDSLTPDERAELLRLRAKVTELEAAGARPGPERSRTTTRLRWVAAIVLITLGAVVATAGVTALWAKRTVFDEDRYIATVAPLAADPGVQDLITSEISAVVFEHVDIDALVQRTLDALTERGVPSQVTALAGPMADGIRAFVTDAIGDLVATDQFQQAWVEANRVAHSELVSTLRGEQEGLTVSSDSVSVDLGAFVAVVKERLVDRGFELAARIPDVSIQFTVLEGVDVASLQRAASLLDTVGTWLPWLAILLLVAGAVVAPRRRTGALVAGAALVASMIVLALLVAATRSWLVERLADASVPRSTAQNIVTDLTYFLRAGLRTTAVLGLIVVLLAWLTGRSAAARSLRRGTSNAAAAVRRRLSPDGEPSGVERWLGGHEAIVTGGVLLVGVVVVLTWDTVSPARLAVLGLIVLLLVVGVRAVAAASRAATGVNEPLPQKGD